MKAVLFILGFFSPVLLFSQSLLPDSIAGKMVEIEFKGVYHALIYRLMPNKGSADAINYVNQLRAQAGSSFDTAKVFSVTVPYRMVMATVENLGNQKEVLTAGDNAILKASLQKQLSEDVRYRDLMQSLGAYFMRSYNEVELLRSEGVKEIMAIDP